jgi:serine/threonine protein kinase
MTDPAAPPAAPAAAAAPAAEAAPKAPPVGALLQGRYRVGAALGRGAFGTTYRGLDVETHLPVAIKVEHAEQSRKHRRYRSPLFIEHAMYRAIHPGRGIPSIEWFGQTPYGYVLIMELLGPSLEHLRQRHEGGVLPLHIVLDLAVQLVRRLEHCHARGVIHRDIKPDNIVLGRDRQRRKCFVVDFGLAKAVRRHGEHIPPREGKKLTGSARYCSVHTHQGLEQSRRDDMESLAYTLIYFLKGRLPWQGIRCRDKGRRYQEIAHLKRTLPVEEVCRQLPPAFAHYLRRCRRLAFTETPPYEEFRQLFKALGRTLKHGSVAVERPPPAPVASYQLGSSFNDDEYYFSERQKNEAPR